MTCCLTRLTEPFSTLSGITSPAPSSSWVGWPALWCYDSHSEQIYQQDWKNVSDQEGQARLKIRHFGDFCDWPSNPFGDFLSITFISTIPESHYSFLNSSCHTVKVIYKSCNEIQKNMFDLQLRDVIKKQFVVNKTW